MTVKHRTYLDLSDEQRRVAANDARSRLRTHLTNPFITGDQTAFIQSRLAEIDKWERGEVEVGPIKAKPVKKSVAHSVSLVEKVGVKEK